MKSLLKLEILNEVVKGILYLPLCVLVSTMASCEDAGKIDCELKVKVLEGEGSPVDGAEVAVRYPVGIKVNPGGGFPTDRNETSKTVSDSKGEAALNYQTVSSPEGLLWIRKNEYYPSVYQSYPWEQIGERANHYRAELTAILKPIKNPIPMIARKDLRIRTPEFGVIYGFDLKMGESMPPLGIGKFADIEFILSGTRTDLGVDNKEHVDFKVEIRCPNPDDGFVDFEIEDSLEFSKGSALQSGHESPAGGYVNGIIRRYANNEDGGMTAAYDIKNEIRNNCAYFRVRTQRNEKGEIVSAHYGKMYGPIEIRPALRQYGHYDGTGQGGFYIQYMYFNPTPNDRNVEFDPKRNLNPDCNVQQP